MFLGASWITALIFWQGPNAPMFSSGASAQSKLEHFLMTSDSSHHSGWPGWQVVYSQMTVHPWKLVQFPQRFILKPINKAETFWWWSRWFAMFTAQFMFFGLVDDAIYLMNMRTLKKSYHVGFKYFWGQVGNTECHYGWIMFFGEHENGEEAVGILYSWG